MVETTFGLVSLSLKRKILQSIKDSQLIIVFDKQFELTKEQAQDVLKKEIKESKLAVYAFVLEGQNAVKEWLNIIERLNTTSFLYGRSNPREIQRNIIWLKSLERPSNIPIKKTRTTTSSEVTPIKKTIPRAQISTDKKTALPTKRVKKVVATTTSKKDELGQRKTTITKLQPKSRVAVTKESKSEITQKQTTKIITKKKDDKKLQEKRSSKDKQENPSADQQAIKQEDPSTDKQEIKQEDDSTDQPDIKHEDSRKEVEINEESHSNETQHSTEKENDIQSSTEATNQQEQESTNYDDTTNELKEDDTLTNERDVISLVSHPSTCSSATTDDHDAEIARVTSKPLLTKKLSMDRPETPEVNQLRSKFEQIIQKSDKTIPAKELKPRGPVGSRVKTMVEMFMDENFNKWEF